MENSPVLGYFVHFRVMCRARVGREEAGAHFGAISGFDYKTDFY